MIKSKLFELLNSLTKEELEAFSDFIKSPYYNKNPYLINFATILYTYLNEEDPHSKQEKLTKEKIFKILLPKKKYQDGEMRKMMTGLTQLVEQFMIAEQLKSNRFLEKRILRKSFSERDLYKCYLKEIKHFEKNKHLAPIQDINPLLESFFIYSNLYFHSKTNRLEPTNDYLSNAMEDLDEFYIQMKLINSIELINRQKLFPNQKKITLSSIVETYVEKKPKNEILKLCISVSQLISKKFSVSEFEEVETLFSRHIHQLTKREQLIILINLINVLTREINQGKLNLVKKNLELYKKAIKIDLQLPNKKITHETFTNVVVYGCHEKEFKWVKNFISDYALYLEEDVNADATRFSKSYLYFSKKEYQKTVDLLWNYNFDKLLFDIRSKSILTRTLLEYFFQKRDIYQLLLNHTNSMERYIRRKKIIGKKKQEAYLNFISVVKKIGKFQYEGKNNKTWIERTKKQILNDDNIIAKIWILERLDEL